jgi:hypothetical protein
MGKGGKADGENALTVLLHGKAVDVSDFSRRHPGGSKVLRIFRDRDATEIFESYHSERAKKMMQAMISNADAAGTVHTERTLAIMADFKALDEKAHSLGCYKTSWPHELMKLTLVFGSLAIGATMMHASVAMSTYSIMFFAVGMFLFCFGEYQAGWVGHDYAHHSVFRSVLWNDAFASVLGGVVQGYDLGWWKARHNTHHTCTNEEGNDPDIKTAPLLTYVSNALNPAKVVDSA